MNIKKINWNGMIKVFIAVALFMISVYVVSSICYDYNILRSDALQTVNQHCIFDACEYTQPGTLIDFGLDFSIFIAPVLIVATFWYILLKIFVRLNEW